MSIEPGSRAVVFVAMRHAGDRWIASLTFTVAPRGGIRWPWCVGVKGELCPTSLEPPITGNMGGFGLVNVEVLDGRLSIDEAHVTICPTVSGTTYRTLLNR